MKIIILAIIICLMNCCQQRKQTEMQYFGCEVFTNNCGQFALVECRQQYCAEYETYYEQQRYYDSSTKSYQYRTVSRTVCVRYDYYYYDNDTCFDKCCGQIENPLQTWNSQTLQSCSKENERLIDERDKLTGIIVGSIFGGIISIVAIVCIVCQCKKGNCSCCDCDCFKGSSSNEETKENKKQGNQGTKQQFNYENNNNYGNNNYGDNDFGNNNFGNNNNFGDKNQGNQFQNKYYE